MVRNTLPLLVVILAVLAGMYGASRAFASDSPPSTASTALDTIREASYSRSAHFRRTARILNWNIDRGQHLAGIEAEMRARRPDLCIFQEVDFQARRTHGQDIAQTLAEVFGMNYSFAPEFEELSQKTSAGAAYHGQAVLSTLPILSSRILRFENQSGFWKPRPLLISSLAILQRREGGRIAQITELDNGGRRLVVYNLHLESRGNEQLRLRQLNEVLQDAGRYPQDVPVIIAGDFNTKSRRSPLIARLNQAGYQSCFGDRRLRTHIFIGALDWVFLRGPIQAEDARVVRGAHASDHFPISLEVRF
ncbi:MAG TPA: endonuclease/exonuclease/phosphatase family protein [Bryobacteraceae bacterium]|nr:endonuclease/exonuclease/phosphatase family protein [Bryobacteraceae bacterium]